jgi:hypothetical protein
VDLEGQLSNTGKPLNSLTPQGSRATTVVGQGASTAQKRPTARRPKSPADVLGHYSNSEPTTPDDHSSAHLRSTPPSAEPHAIARRLRAQDVDALVDSYRDAGSAANSAKGCT